MSKPAPTDSPAGSRRDGDDPADASMVDRGPRAPGALPPRKAEEEHLPLPHERDEIASGSTTGEPDPGMRRAARDLADGQVDTDMRVPPGLDAERKARYVPGAGGRLPSSSSSDAPPPPERGRPRRGQ